MKDGEEINHKASNSPLGRADAWEGSSDAKSQPIHSKYFPLELFPNIRKFRCVVSFHGPFIADCIGFIDSWLGLWNRNGSHV